MVTNNVWWVTLLLSLIGVSCSRFSRHKTENFRVSSLVHESLQKGSQWKQNFRASSSAFHNKDGVPELIALPVVRPKRPHHFRILQNPTVSTATSQSDRAQTNNVQTITREYQNNLRDALCVMSEETRSESPDTELYMSSINSHEADESSIQSVNDTFDTSIVTCQSSIHTDALITIDQVEVAEPPPRQAEENQYHIFTATQTDDDRIHSDSTHNTQETQSSNSGSYGAYVRGGQTTAASNKTADIDHITFRKTPNFDHKNVIQNINSNYNTTKPRKSYPQWFEEGDDNESITTPYTASPMTTAPLAEIDHLIDDINHMKVDHSASFQDVEKALHAAQCRVQEINTLKNMTTQLKEQITLKNEQIISLHDELYHLKNEHNLTLQTQNTLASHITALESTVFNLTHALITIKTNQSETLYENSQIKFRSTCYEHDLGLAHDEIERLQSTLYNVSVRFNLSSEDVFPPRPIEVSLDNLDGDDSGDSDASSGASSTTTGCGGGGSGGGGGFGSGNRVPPPSSTENESASWVEAIRNQLEGDNKIDTATTESTSIMTESDSGAESEKSSKGKDAEKSLKLRSTKSKQPVVKKTPPKASTTNIKVTLNDAPITITTNTVGKSSSGSSGANRLSSAVRRVLRRVEQRKTSSPPQNQRELIKQTHVDSKSNNSRMSTLFGTSNKRSAKSLKVIDTNTTATDEIKHLNASHLNATRTISNLNSQLIALQQVVVAYQLAIQQCEDNLVSLREAVEEQVAEMEKNAAQLESLQNELDGALLEIEKLCAMVADRDNKICELNVKLLNSQQTALVVQQAADLKYASLKEQHVLETRSLTDKLLLMEREKKQNMSPFVNHLEDKEVQDLIRSKAHLQAENIAHNITIEYLTGRLRNVTTENERLSGRVDNIVQQLDHEHHYTGGGGGGGWSRGGVRAVSVGLTQSKIAFRLWKQNIISLIRRFGGLFVSFGELLKTL